MLRNGTAAPGFVLPDEDGRGRPLDEIHGGRPLLLYFFRGEFCPTAQRDLVNYANTYDRMRAVGAEMAAISAETVSRHRELKDRLKLPFLLLSDTGFLLSERYGVYRSDDQEG